MCSIYCGQWTLDTVTPKHKGLPMQATPCVCLTGSSSTGMWK